MRDVQVAPPNLRLKLSARWHRILAECPMEAIFLACGANGPQLKRNPLGGEPPMKIACLGWGSLIWDPRVLPIQRPWLEDGPLAPVQFRRKSLDGRIPLVLDPQAAPVPLLWGPMLLTELNAAKEALAEREQLTGKTRERGIGCWQTGDRHPTQYLRSQNGHTPVISMQSSGQPLAPDSILIILCPQMT